MSRSAVLLTLLVAACVSSDAGRPAVLGNAQDWRFASGKLPTRIEYAAAVAACRDGAVVSAKGRPLDLCLADLGLRRAE